MSRADGRMTMLDVLRSPDVRASMLGTFVIMLGFGIVAPVLPAYAQSFGVGYDAIGLLVAAFAFSRLVADPFVGRFIDRYGERATTTVGAAWVGVTSIGAALAPSFTLLVVFRAAGGAGTALFFAAVLSFLLRKVPAERSGRVMGVYYASFNVGFIVGGPLGGVLANHFGLASPLWVYSATCLLSALLFWRTIHDPARGDAETRVNGWRRLPWNRPFVTVLVVNAAYMWVMAAVFQTLIPLFGTGPVIGLSLEGLGVALAVATATELVALYPAGRASDSRGRRAILIPALAGLAVVIVVLGRTSTVPGFMLAMAALGVASAYSGVPPAPMLSDVTPAEQMGTSVAVFRFVGDLGFVLGPLVAGWAAGSLGFGSSFAINAVPVLIALGLVLSIRETMQAPRTADASS